MLQQVLYDGHIEEIQILIDAKANIEVVDINGMTPLHLSACRGQVEVMQILINAKANIEATDNKGQTPLILAIQRNQVEAKRILRDASGYWVSKKVTL